MQEYCENKIATSFQACGDFSVCKPPVLFLQSPSAALVAKTAMLSF
jgi:hypothetical protein